MAMSTLDSITAMHKYEKVGHCAELWEQSMASQKMFYLEHVVWKKDLCDTQKLHNWWAEFILYLDRSLKSVSKYTWF